MRRKLTPRSFAAVTAPYANRAEMQARAAAELDAILGDEKQRRPAMNWERAEVECEEMRKLGDWSRARAIHAVALYAWCHAQCYRVAAEELVGKGAAAKQERLGAVSAASRMLKAEFDNNFVAFVAFVQWAWREERRKEGWAKGKGIVLSKRLGWRRQFSSALVVDYRAARLRQRAAAE